MYFIITTRRPYAGQQLRQVVHVVHVKYPWVLFRMTGLCKGFSTASIMSSTADDGFDGEWIWLEKTKLLFDSFLHAIDGSITTGSIILYRRITKAFRNPNAKQQFNMAPLRSDQLTLHGGVLDVLFIDLHNIWKIPFTFTPLCLIYLYIYIS